MHIFALSKYSKRSIRASEIPSLPIISWTGNKYFKRLNDLSVFLLEMIYENEQFRISNRHLEPQPIYTELNQLVDLYSQNLKMITKLEFMK